ncbi:UNVERIFIED_CONTAM: hypothetical protein O8I53_09665 [Campylobacter lari]
MSKYRPIQNNQTIEIVKNNQEIGFANGNKAVYQDPKKQISPRVYKVIRGEKILKITLMIISFVLMTLALIFFTLTYFKINPFNSGDNEKPYIGYMILFGSISGISLSLGLKNLIENIQ